MSDFNTRYYEMKEDRYDDRTQEQIDTDFERTYAERMEEQRKIASGEIVLRKTRTRKPTAKQIERRERKAAALAAKNAEREARKAERGPRYNAIKKAQKKMRAAAEQGDTERVAELEAKIADLTAANDAAIAAN